VTYRDDREALQARVEALEGELASQKSHYEQELDALRVGVTPPSKRKSRLLLTAGIAAAVVVLGGVAVGLLASSSGRSDEPVVVEMVQTPPAPKADYVPMRTEAHRWHGRVVSATGTTTPLQAGAECAVMAGVMVRANRDEAEDTRVTLFYCGEERFVQITGANAFAPTTATGMAKRSSPGATHFTLGYRSGPEKDPAVQIDTARGVAHVHDGAVKVEIQMDAESEGPLDPTKVPPRWVRDAGAAAPVISGDK